MCNTASEPSKELPCDLLASHINKPTFLCCFVSWFVYKDFLSLSFMGEKNVLLARTASDAFSVLGSDRHEELYRSLSVPFGTNPRTVYSLVNFWRMGLVYASTSGHPRKPHEVLRRLSVFLNALSVPETHPLITELTRYEGFRYPPQETCGFSLTHKERLIVKLKCLDKSKLPEIERYLDGLVER